MAPTDRLLQLLNQHDQLCDSFLQPCYNILAVLKGSLLETQETLEVDYPVLQEKVFLRTTVDPIVCRLPLTGEDAIVFHYCLFNPVHGRQSLHMIFLGICFDLADLGSMSSPLTFRIVHLEGNGLGLSKSPTSVSLTRDSSFNVLGRRQRVIAVLCQIACIAWCIQSLGAFQLRTPI